MTRDAQPPVLTLPWQVPERAFATIAQTDFALLLHGGNTASRIYAFPSETIRQRLAPGEFDTLAARLRVALSDGKQIAGLFSYELAGAFEDLSRPEGQSWDDVNLGIYPAWAVFDPIGLDIAIYGESVAAKRLAEALTQQAPKTPTREPVPVEWKPQWPRGTYLEACRRVREHVRAGDIYQANLSQGFDIGLAKDDRPYDVFCRLVDTSPAPFGGYFHLDADHAVLTNSPELFLSLRQGVVETRPIKGTRPRGSTNAEDSAFAQELESSDKDRAENLMIVDLMRHDLSRVCQPGSVSVPELCALKSFANVHHLVSVVRGDMQPACDALDAVAACFPPGSITGAPKIRAMDIIAAEEGMARGPYCGAMGWIGRGGAAMDLNVMIRTAAMTRDTEGWSAVIRSGGAITIDSDPDAEFEETLAKASALRAAFQS